jgi:hypothetical protein
MLKAEKKRLKEKRVRKSGTCNKDTVTKRDF